MIGSERGVVHRPGKTIRLRGSPGLPSEASPCRILVRSYLVSLATIYGHRRRLRDNHRAPVCKETGSDMSPQSDSRIQHHQGPPYESVVKASAEACLQRSRRLLLETSSMVDPRKNGRPLQRSKAVAPLESDK